MKRLLTGVLVGLALALLPVGASAAPWLTEYLNGVETGVPPNCPGGSSSPFTGTAHGTVQGVWWARICHGDLPNADILGGTFTLQTPSRRVVGQFQHSRPDTPVREGVWFTDEWHFAGACQQHYKVRGPLSNGYFDGTLTHYGGYYWGSCHVFSASVSGTASLWV
ncbi:MAG: hypothetical protein M3075_20720 [Candidatus Dormibacteraeota bacterium]|jgi:hypothetical protein|nr:hypothetical protein [Candidatus Dormibacteraeota bacterium]